MKCTQDDRDFAAYAVKHIDGGTHPSDRMPAAGTSRSRLANFLGIHRNTVSAYLKGKSPIPYECAMSIKEFLFGSDPAFATEREEFDGLAAKTSGGIKYAMRFSEAKGVKFFHNNIGSELISQYDNIARAEWIRIKERALNLSPDSSSTTYVSLFGWNAALGLMDVSLNPRISGFRIAALSKEVAIAFDDESADQLLSKICTMRYMISCFLVANSFDEYPQYIVNSLIEGWYSPMQNDRIIRREMREIARCISRSPSINDAPILVKKLIYNASILAANARLTIQDMIAEENNPSRLSMRQLRSNQLSHDHTVTHHIDIYMTDQKGVYYSVMQAVRSGVEWNIIRSVSDTLVPGNLAMARLMVSCERTKNDIRAAIDRATSAVSSHILDIIVEELPTVSVRVRGSFD